MGACDFTTVAVGRTAREAYNNAVDEATHRYGTDAYNGTISTTTPGGFILFERPKGQTMDVFKRKHLLGDWDELGISKWGPCGCICLGRPKGAHLRRGYRAYLFFGWASE